MNISYFLTFSSALALQFKYALVFLGVIVEGPLLMVACGFLYKMGVFDLFPLYMTLVMGDLVSDVGWYYIGYFFAKPFLQRFGKFFGFKEEHLEKVHELFHLYKNRILIISKVTIGFGMAILIILFAGMTKIKLKTFLLLNSIGETIMVGALLALGYFVGNLYTYLDKGYRDITLFGTAVVIIAIIYRFSKYAKEKVLGNEL